MSNQGFLELGLLDTASRPANDAGVRVVVFRLTDNREIAKFTDLTFPPSHKFRLPAFPQENNLYCQVTPTRFRHRNSSPFFLTDGETVTRNLTLFRLPGQWSAAFDAWDQLPNFHHTLKRVLDVSPDVKVRGGGKLGKFTEATYDGADDEKTQIAKAALLNLYTKLIDTIEPTGGIEPWFSLVRRVLEIGRERFIAIVDPRMEQCVRTIREKIGQFPDYSKAKSDLHLKNFPASFNVVKSSMLSVKTKEDKGNLQLTMARGKDEGGADVFLLDADIDENGQLMKHLADLLKHKFNGGTHPYDIHEYLVMSSPNRPLGYRLV